MKVMIKTTNQDYDRLLNALAACGYHWVSGQLANVPPSIFQTVHDAKHPDADIVYGARVINTEEKLLGYYPLEVLTPREREETLRKAKDVDHAIAFLANHHHCHLDQFYQRSAVSEDYQKFAAAFQKLILEKYRIDIVELMQTDNENVQYVKMHAQADAKAILCKNMQELYQDYLNNLLTIEQYAEFVGIRYQRLLEEVEQNERSEAEEELCETK